MHNSLILATTLPKDEFFSQRFVEYFDNVYRYYLEHGVFDSTRDKENDKENSKENSKEIHESRRYKFRRAMIDNPHNPRNYKKCHRLEVIGREINWRCLVKHLLVGSFDDYYSFCLQRYLFVYSRWEFDERRRYFYPTGYPEYSATFLQDLLINYFENTSWRFSLDMLILSNLRLPLGQINKEYQASRFIVEKIENVAINPYYEYCRRKLQREFEELSRDFQS